MGAGRSKARRIDVRITGLVIHTVSTVHFCYKHQYLESLIHIVYGQLT